MRVLVLGGTGLLGPHVVRGLLQRGHRVWTLTRRGLPALTEVALTGDRRDPRALASAIGTARPDLLIDMIPFVPADAAGLPQIPLVALSSIDVCAGYLRMWGAETPHQPIPWARTRSCATGSGSSGFWHAVPMSPCCECPCFTAGRIRPGWPNGIDPMLDGAEEIRLSEDRAIFQVSRALHLNAAHAVLCAAESVGGHRVYNVAEPVPMTEREWIARIAEVCGWRGKIVIGPWEGPRPRQHLTVSTERIRSDLGYRECADPGDGLRDTVLFHAFQRRGGTYRKGY